MEQKDEQSELRKYILGNVSKTDRAAIDERLLTDDLFFEQFSITEENFIQDYVDGNLDKAERERFENCFLNSEENRRKVKFAAALRKYVRENATGTALQKKPNFFSSLAAFFSSPVPVALAVLIIVGVVGFFALKNYSNRSDVLVALNKAYKAERPLDARISDFEYAPTKNTRGAGDKANNIESELAKTLALKSVSENPTPENLQALGRVYLAEKEFDKAAEQLSKAVKLAPDNAKIHNDLGVALMEKAKRLEEGKLENLAKSNEEFAKAIELDKNLLDAYFNQALCIQELNLPNQAKEAWQKYLELDPNSQWSEEARKNLNTLESQKPISKTKEEILQEFFQAKQSGDDEKAWQTLSRNRDLGLGKLIPQQLAFLFAESKTIGDENKAGEALESLVYAGNLEAGKSGDLFWKELADRYKKNTNTENFLFKKSHDLMKESAKQRMDGNLDSALKGFETAKNIFTESQNTVEEKLCENWIAAIFFQLGKLEESNKLFINLAEFSEQHKFRWLATQAYIRLAYGVTSQNKHSKSIEYSLKALALAEQTNDVYNLRRIFAALSYDYRCLGRYELSLQFSEKSLALGSFDTISVQRWEAFESLTNVLIEIKLCRTAILIQNEALSVIRLLKDSVNEQISLLYLGTLYSNIGDYQKAADFFEEGIKKAETFESEKGRQKALAFANLRYANLKRIFGDCEGAVKQYEMATGFYENSGFQLNNYETHKGKLLCYLQTKNDSAIQNELPLMIDLFAKYRKEILEEQNRNSFFDNGQDIYDIAVDYEFGRSNFAEAFDYAEESRSRSLLDLQNSAVEVSTDLNQPQIKFSENLSNPLRLTQIQSEMPEDSQLLVYSVLPERILMWSVTKNDLKTVKTEISSDDLQQKVSNYLELISKNIEPNEQLRLSKELYQILVSPVRDSLNRDKQIIIIPDKILLHLPFAALFAEKYFIEDYKISYSPSANVFLNCTKKAAELATRKTETLLSIGNPSFNQAAYDNALPPLPLAKNEAEAVAEKYDNSLVFTEKTATKKNFKENIGKADVVHFAGHYIVDEKSPLLSSLVLAGNKKEESSLANYEIFGEKLPHARLIVLSACDTELEKYYKGEGMIGASRMFLAMNVPLVVASQWSVDSDSTKELMINFHNFRKTDKLTTAEALRQSQLAMLQNERFKEPYYWAAFALLGGYTQF